jgi:hypothetical protein
MFWGNDAAPLGFGFSSPRMGFFGTFGVPLILIVFCVLIGRSSASLRESHAVKMFLLSLRLSLSIASSLYH